VDPDVTTLSQLAAPSVRRDFEGTSRAVDPAMRVLSRSWVWLLVLATGLPACRDSHAAPPPRARSALVRISSNVVSQLPKDKKKRRHDATVYLDGNPVAFVKFLELPPGLAPAKLPAGDTRKAPRWSVAAYLEALRIDTSRIKQVHFYGGRGRVAVVDGAELRAKRDLLRFRFTAGDRGNLRMEWPGRDELTMTGTQTDIVSDIAVYLDRDPPRYDVLDGKVVDETGKPFPGIPFAPMERPGGTRVYIDGRFISAIKRKTLPDSVVIPGSAEAGRARFSLVKYLEMAGIDPRSIRALEAVSKESIVATRTGDALASDMPGLEFVMPKESKGLAEMTALAPDRKLEALLLSTDKLPDRGAVRAESGSPVPHDDPENPERNDDPTAARGVH
jgi:hypothetical protein